MSNSLLDDAIIADLMRNREVITAIQQLYLARGYDTNNVIELAPMSDSRMPYDEAVLYCQFLTHNNHSDWRMPGNDEYWMNLPLMEFHGWYTDRKSEGLLLNVTPVRNV